MELFASWKLNIGSRALPDLDQVPPFCLRLSCDANQPKVWCIADSVYLGTTICLIVFSEM